MKIYIGCDHAGFELKQQVMAALPDMNWQDVGTHSLDSVDYPDYADKVCEKVGSADIELHKAHEEDSLKSTTMGLLICGSGQGMSIRANKFKHVRAGLCWTPEIAALSREHNNANVLCLPSRFIKPEDAIKCIEVFFKTHFSGGRHSRRVEKLSRDTNC